MKKIIVGITAVVILFGSGFAAPAFSSVSCHMITANAADIAEEGQCGENVFYTLDADGLLTISGTGDMGNYNYSPFMYSTSVHNVVIEEGVTSIGEGAFFGCNELTSVQIPEGVTTVRREAFQSCEKLTNINLPDSLTAIEYGAFSDCTGLESIIIPNNVTSIGYASFSGCSGITSIVIPENVSSIGKRAFMNCGSLKDIKVSENNKNYSDIDGVLSNKEKTEIIYFPEGKEYTEYTIPDGVTSIGTEAFYANRILTGLIIPDSVTSIGESAFWGCTFKTLKLSDNLESFEETSFAYWKGTAEIVIPASVTNISRRTFFGCDDLKNITVLNKDAYIDEEAFGYTVSVGFLANVDDFTITGYAGSTAETYAIENEFEFIEIGSDEPTPEFTLGDVDGDGTISAMDASAALTYYVMQPDSVEDLGFPFDIKAADWDGNGIINAIDASAILTYYVSH